MKNRFIVLSCVAFLLASCGEQYYRVDDFLSVKKIDTHVHLNAESTSLARQAQNDNFTLLTVNVDVPAYPSLETQEQFAVDQVNNNPNVQYVTAFAMANWDSPSWQAEVLTKLKHSFEKGALGIKLWKNIGMVVRDSTGKLVMIDDPRFDPIIQFVIDNKKTVMGHLGEPKNCWLPIDQMTVNNDRDYFSKNPQYHMFQHPEMPSYEDQINARDRFLERHPDMRFVGAHLGSLEWSVDELAKRLDKFPNMAVDMAARIPHLQHQCRLNYDKVRAFMIKYQDRLIYGTDTGLNVNTDPELVKKHIHETWQSDWKYFVTDEMMVTPVVNGQFKGLKLPRSVVDKIYRENAKKWFQL